MSLSDAAEDLEGLICFKWSGPLDQSVLYTSEEEKKEEEGEEKEAECALCWRPGAAVAGDICPWQGEYT